MKKLFLVDAYALIFKYYYAFLGRPMRNRAGMNTSVVFGFVKFLRDIQKRERPDLLGVAFDPRYENNTSFRTFDHRGTGVRRREFVCAATAEHIMAYDRRHESL